MKIRIGKKWLDAEVIYIFPDLAFYKVGKNMAVNDLSGSKIPNIQWVTLAKAKKMLNESEYEKLFLACSSKNAC